MKPRKKVKQARSSAKKHVHYKGKAYSVKQAAAGFAGPANQKRYG